MSSNPVDQEQEYNILQRLKAVEDALREFRTPQKQGSDVVRITRSGVVLQIATVGANSGSYMGIAPQNGDGQPTFNDIENFFYIPATAKVLNWSFYLGAAGNFTVQGTVPVAVTAFSSTSMSFATQAAGNEQAFPNLANSNIQGFVRYIA